MAAIDPSEAPVREDVDDTSETLAILKLVRYLGDDSDEDDEDYDLDSDEDSYEDEDEDGVNGGPSDPKKVKSLKKQALLEALAADEDEDMDDDSESGSEDEAEAQEVLAKLQQALKDDKGKGKATEGDDSDSEADSDEALEQDEHVICTLNRIHHPQQTLDFTVSEHERVFFKVVGNFTVSVTGNYVLPPFDPSEQDLEPDSDEELDELDGLDELAGDSDSEIDELDDLDDPRVTEVDEDDDAGESDMKKLIKQAGELKKGKNKRPAEDSDDDEPALDDMISKALHEEPAPAATTNGETKKLSKAEKKRLKKLNNNEGVAAEAPAAATTSTAAPETNGAKDKKVQFAKNLEQGPTPSPSSTVKASSTPATSAPSVRTVQGITIDDRKIGNGPAAKKGNTLSMRYIGKLDSGKVFDSNKSGKPFSFKMGVGEVIKGWDIGLEGLQNGGERRIKIPGNLAYGKKGAPPDIPPNATLTFDVKCVGVK